MIVDDEDFMLFLGQMPNGRRLVIALALLNGFIANASIVGWFKRQWRSNRRVTRASVFLLFCC